MVAGADHFTSLFESPDTDLEELLQQVWDQVVAGAVERPPWIPADMLPDLGRNNSLLPHGTISTTAPVTPDPSA